MKDLVAETLPDNGSISDLESDLQTDQSVVGSPLEHSAGMDNSSPTNSGPDSEVASVVSDLPPDARNNLDMTEDLSNKVAAATSYVGSFFNPSSWKNMEKSPESGAEAGQDKERKNSVSGSGLISSSLFNAAIGKVQGLTTKVSPSDEKPKDAADEETAAEGGKQDEQATGGGFFSAFSKIGTISGMASSGTVENIAAAGGKTPTEEGDDGEDKRKETWGNSLSNAFNKVGKVATDYSKVVQETVYKAPLIADFNKEQEEFIKAKNDKETPAAPWAGYQNEEELKQKILALSEDQRNVTRAPPSGVNFDFEYSSLASPALILLEADPKLKQLRYELVPKTIKEDEFWKNYFYRVSLIKQSFELSNSITEDAKKEKKMNKASEPAAVEDDDSINTPNTDPDDEFVSDLHQASSKDIAEADEAMKKLGLTKNDTEWEAELEGELNEYEMLDDEGDDVDTEDNPEWENQIQEMLDAESKKT